MKIGTLIGYTIENAIQENTDSIEKENRMDTVAGSYIAACISGICCIAMVRMIDYDIKKSCFYIL